LFTGNEIDGKTMAVLFSLVSSCPRHGHDPFPYLRDVPARSPSQPAESLSDQVPNRWSPPNAADPTAEDECPRPAEPVGYIVLL